MKKTMLPPVLQAIAVAIALAILGGVWSTYMAVHDLQITVAAQKDKVDWLYKYFFPEHR